MKVTRDSKKIVSFRGTVPAGQEKVFKYALLKDGTIEHVSVRIYSGSVNQLQIRPFLVQWGEVWEPIIKYPSGGNDYISGDDDRMEWDLVMPFLRGNYIEVRVMNNGTFDYDLNVSFEIDHYGGVNRVV